MGQKHWTGHNRNGLSLLLISSAGARTSKEASSLVSEVKYVSDASARMVQRAVGSWNDLLEFTWLEPQLLSGFPCSPSWSLRVPPRSAWPLHMVSLAGQTDFLHDSLGLPRAKSRLCHVFLRLQPKRVQPHFFHILLVKTSQ